MTTQDHRRPIAPQEKPSSAVSRFSFSFEQVVFKRQVPEGIGAIRDDDAILYDRRRLTVVSIALVGQSPTKKSRTC